jgi:hypothetical protein
MNSITDLFIACIRNHQKGYLTFYSQKDNKIVKREIAPLDFWPRRMPKGWCFNYADNGADKFHYYDFDWSGGGHATSKDVTEVQKFELIDDFFDPKKIVTRQVKCPWHIARER